MNLLNMPTVSVWITTYNHEQFIAKAIESVLMQNTNFDFEIIIGEDCSKDKTREIVVSYKNKYPGKIRLFLPEKNLGCNEMFYATYPLCAGKYIAWLDGDDYWIDPYKLQKQFDFMELNKNISFCFHKVIVVNTVENSIQDSLDPYRDDDETLNFEHFLGETNPVNTPSVFHRNILGKQLPDWFYELPLADLGFYFLLLAHGKAFYSTESLAAYCIHHEGAWSGSSIFQQHHQLATFNQIIKPHLPAVFDKQIDSFICFHCSMLFEVNFRNGKYREALNNFRQMKKYNFRGLGQRKLWIGKMIIKIILKPVLRKKQDSYLNPN